MTIIVRDASNTPRTVTNIIVRDATNTPRTITAIYVRDANNVPRLVYGTGSAPGGPLTASAFPNAVDGTAPEFSTIAVTNSTTLTVSGGTAPYSVLWTVQSYTSPYIAPSALNDTAMTTAFSQTNLSKYSGVSAVFKATISDSTTPTPATTDVLVSAAFYGWGVA